MAVLTIENSLAVCPRGLESLSGDDEGLDAPLGQVVRELEIGARLTALARHRLSPCRFSSFWRGNHGGSNVEERRFKYAYGTQGTLKYEKMEKGIKKARRIGQGYEWWLRGDSNPRHTGYEPVALTNWATQPFMVELIGIEPTTSCLQSTRSPS